MKCRLKISTLAVWLLFIFLTGAAVTEAAAQTDLTKRQAIARVQSILRNNAARCRMRTRSITAVPAVAGWRVTARVVMAASGRPINETAVWIVSRRYGASAQNQLTAEIGMGCL